MAGKCVEIRGLLKRKSTDAKYVRLGKIHFYADNGWKSYIFFPHSMHGGRLTFPTVEYYYGTTDSTILFRLNGTQATKEFLNSLSEKFYKVWEDSARCKGCKGEKSKECRGRITGEYFGRTGVFGLFRYGWGAEDASSLYWHTGDPDTDPWEWRMRVLNERNDIAYSKMFFRKAGYITKEWYPYFLAARRGGKSFDDMYADGIYSNYAKRIYELLRDNDSLPLHEIKSLGGFDKKDTSKFEKALTDLQMGMFITMSGMQQKVSRIGIEYGWFSTVFCTTERFWGNDVFEKSAEMNEDEATEKITERILELNPSADKKKIVKFIRG